MKSIVYVAFAAALLSFAPRAVFSAETDPKDIYEPKPLDGVVIQAVETYPYPKDNSIGFGVGIYPFDPYFTGLLINASYQYNLSRNIAWEILNLSYVHSFRTSLTDDLSDNFGVSQDRLERANFLLSSSLHFHLTHGKFVLFSDYMRYFRTSFLLGLGFVSKTVLARDTTALSSNTSTLSSTSPTTTATGSTIAGHFGFRIEVLTSETFAWRLDIRDNVTIPGMDNIVTFTLGMGLAF